MNIAADKIALIFISIPIVVWAWLFMINYLIKDPKVSVLRHLIGAVTPFEHNNYKLAIPSISVFLNAFTALKIWFWKFAMVDASVKTRFFHDAIPKPSRRIM